MKTVEAHGHFVQSMAWGRATIGGSEVKANGAGADSKGAEEAKRINVIATGSVDQTIKIWTP